MQDAYFLFLGPIGRMGRMGPISCDRSYGSYGIDGLISLMGFIGLILMMDQNLSGRHPLAHHQCSPGDAELDTVVVNAEVLHLPHSTIRTLCCFDCVTA